MLTEAILRALVPSDELPVATYRLVFDGGTGLALRVGCCVFGANTGAAAPS
jgi:hypothetical protein